MSNRKCDLVPFKNMAATGTPSPKPSTSIPALERIFTSSTDSQISHINRLLSTAAGIDSALLLVGYSLYIVSAQLKCAATFPDPRRALVERAYKLVSGNDSSKMPSSSPSKGYQQTLSAIGDSAKTFGGMCSDVRMFMRLWGLFKIYAGAKATYNAPPKDGILKSLAWAQLASIAAYLGLEHCFYLQTKGVLKSLSTEKAASWFKTGIWMYVGYIVMDYARLWRIWQIRERERKVEGLAQGQKGSGTEGEKSTVREREKQDAAWWRSLQVSVAYSPLCLHWAGVEKAALGDASVGLCGAWAGWIGVKEAWRATA